MPIKVVSSYTLILDFSLIKMKLNNDEVLESQSKQIYHKYTLEFKLNVKRNILPTYLTNGELSFK